jgi:hypothetical protein
MRKLALVALMSMLSLGAFAQHPGGPPEGAGKPAKTPADIAANEVKFLTVLLDLDANQESKATTFFTAAENSKATLEADIEKQEEALAAAVIANKSSDITAAATKIGTDTAGIALAQANAEAAFYQILSSDQKTKYGKYLNGEFVVPGNGHGPGNGNGNGPGGGNPPPGHGNGHNN